MTYQGFEGSYLGDASRIEQIPPGTPFTALPEHWRCPQCDGDRDQFMVTGKD